MKKVLIIVGSDSDLEVMSTAGKVLDEFGVEYEMIISSAHRSPDRTRQLVEKAKEDGIKVIIAGAGMAAHLAGVIAAEFTLPVIGVPIQSGSLNGIDALLSTMQMPSGVPVATVAINGARNGGILAVQILATSDSGLEEKLIEYKKGLAKSIEEKARKLKEE